MAILARPTRFSPTTSGRLATRATPNWHPADGGSVPGARGRTRFDTPLPTALGAMARVGQGFAYTGYNRDHPRVQRWRDRVCSARLSNNMMIEVSYWGQWADRIIIAAQTGLRFRRSIGRRGNVRNNAIATT